MALYLTEQQVGSLVSMEMALEAVETAFRELAQQPALNQPRQRVRLPNGVLHVMAGAVPARSVLGLKAYPSFARRARFLVLLYAADSGELLAMVEANRLGQMRTGAASGVATRYLACQDACVVGQFGVGSQAETQLSAVCAVRPIQRALVYSRNPARAQAFARSMTELLGIEVQPSESPERLVREAEVLTTITSAQNPVFPGEWLQPGVHVNAAGSNWAQKRELDAAAVSRADLVVVDALDQAKIESGDVIAAVDAGALAWERVVELGPIVAGQRPGRTGPGQITLFESQGLAVEDVALAAAVYARAREQGLGAEIPGVAHC